MPYERAVWSELGRELDTAYRMQKLLTKPASRWLLDKLVHRAARRPRVRQALVDMMERGEVGELASPLSCMRLLIA